MVDRVRHYQFIPIEGGFPLNDALEQISNDLNEVYSALNTLEELVNSLTGFWLFDDSTVMADPGAQRLRFNNAQVGSTTQMAMSTQNVRELDASRYLEVVTTGDEIAIVDSRRNILSLFTVSAAPTNNTSWFLIPVTFNAGDTGNLTVDDLIQFTWYPDRV